MSELIFKEDTHEYWYGDTQLTSVTTWLGEFEAPFDVKEVSKKYAKWLRKSGYIGVDDKKVTAKVVQKHWDFIREEGTRVHRQIEGLIKGEKIFPYPNKKARDAYEYVEKEMRSMDKPRSVPELRIHSTRFGLAGMLDMPVFVGMDLHLYDWKIVDKMTPAKLKKYTLQLSTYAYLMEVESRVTVKALKLVQVTDEGVKVHEIEYKKDKVIEMLKASGRW